MDLVNKKVENKSLWEGIPPWVRRLGLRALTAEGPDSIPGWELGSHQPSGKAKKKVCRGTEEGRAARSGGREAFLDKGHSLIY